MSINLLPWRAENRLRCKNNVYRKIKVWGSILLLCWLSWQMWNIYQTLIVIHKIKLNQNLLLNTEQKYLRAKKIVHQGRMQQQLESQLQKSHAINLALFHLLDKISTIMPNELYLVDVEKKEKNLCLVGKSPSHANLAQLLSRLDTSLGKRKMSLQGTNQTLNADSSVDFNLSFDLSALE